MGVDPYLKLICGIESEQNDSRFSKTARDLTLAVHDCYYLGEMAIPPLCRTDRLWENVDLVTAWPVGKKKRPLFEDIFYEGNPAGGYAWRDGGEPVGYIVEDCHAQTLLRCLFLVPGFGELFGGEGGHVVLDSMKPEEHELEYIHASGGRRIDNVPEGDYQRHQRERVDKAIAENRWISMFSPFTTDNWYSIALHLLHLAGWIGVTRQDLRIMVVFDWA